MYLCKLYLVEEILWWFTRTIVTCYVDITVGGCVASYSLSSQLWDAVTFNFHKFYCSWQISKSATCLLMCASMFLCCKVKALTHWMNGLQFLVYHNTLHAQHARSMQWYRNDHRLAHGNYSIGGQLDHAFGLKLLDPPSRERWGLWMTLPKYQPTNHNSTKRGRTRLTFCN